MLSGWPKRRHVLLYVSLTVLTVLVTYFMLIKSESFEFAQHFVIHDQRVLQVTGKQTSTRFAPLKGFRSTFGERTGEASFVFNVSGERGHFQVQVELTKRDGSWLISQARATGDGGVAAVVVGDQLP